MGGYAKFCIENLFGWLKSLIQQVWTLFSDQKGNNLLSWAGENWKGIILVLCVSGVIIDLLVYLFRWEPIKVWKSYFRRRKTRGRPVWQDGTKETEYYGYDIPDEEPEDDVYYSGNQQMTAPDVQAPYIPEETDDFYQEEIPVPPVPAGPFYSAPNMPAKPEHRAMYRRPEQNPGLIAYSGYDYDPRSLTERNLEKVIGPHRKKLRVNELFRDTDEGSPHYEAPQPVIDQTEAYRAPVFPRNWNDNGDNPS